MIVKSLLHTLIFLMFTVPNLLAQADPDSIFNAALWEAKDRNYSAARISAEKALAIDSLNVEVMIFLANVNAWDHKYNEAKKYINHAYKLNRSSADLYDSWLNILLWNNEPEELLKTCTIAESNNYSNRDNLFLKRLLAFQALKNYRQVISLVQNEKNKELRDSPRVSSVFNEALLLSKNHTISAYYSLDLFDVDSPQQLAYIDYGLKIRENKLLFRLNASSRFGLNGVQLESDYYQVMKNKSYMYFNYGYSIDNHLFPDHRAGYEIYIPLKNKFEVSVGGRYMRYPGENIFISTLHLAKYISNNWLSVRPYYAIQQNGKPFTILLNYRSYSERELKYWGLEFGYGNSPDDRYALTQNNAFFGLKSLKMKIEKNMIIGRTSELKIGASFADEEYIKGSFRNRYSVDLLFKFRM